MIGKRTIMPNWTARTAVMASSWPWYFVCAIRTALAALAFFSLPRQINPTSGRLSSTQVLAKLSHIFGLSITEQSIKEDAF